MGKNKKSIADRGEQARKRGRMQKNTKKQYIRNKKENKEKNKQIRMLRYNHQNENNKKKMITYKSKQTKGIKKNLRKKIIKQANFSNRKINRSNIKKSISNQKNKKQKIIKSGKNQKVDQNFYQIDKVIKYRKSDDGYEQYFVSWVGYPPTTNCWVDKDRIKGIDLQNLEQYLEELSIQQAGSENNMEDAQQVRPKNKDEFLDNSQSQQKKQEASKNAANGESQQSKSKLKNNVEGYQIISIQEDSDNNCNEVRQQLAYPSLRTRRKNAYNIYRFPNQRLNKNRLLSKKGNRINKIKIIPHPHKHKYRFYTSNAQKLADLTMKQTNSKQIQQSEQSAQKEMWEGGNNYVEIDGDPQKMSQKQKNEKFSQENSEEQKSNNGSKQEQISHEKNAPITFEMNHSFLTLPSFNKLSKEELDILRRFYYPHLA